MNRLRQWRADNDVSLAEAADLTGLSEAHLSRIERGLRTPSPRARVVIARRLGARVADLFDPEPVPGYDNLATEARKLSEVEAMARSALAEVERLTAALERLGFKP